MKKIEVSHSELLMINFVIFFSLLIGKKVSTTYIAIRIKISTSYIALKMVSVIYTVITDCGFKRKYDVRY